MRMIFSFCLLLGFHSVAQAQCTKDTDCKGDRICQGGECVAPTAKAEPVKEVEVAESPAHGRLMALARAAAEDIAMPADRQRTALAKLNQVLRLAKTQDRLGEGGHVCMVAYHSGEGGFIVKKTKGKGALKCEGRPSKRFAIKAVQVGALIGGSSEWGVGIVFELREAQAFGGEYRGSTRGATFASESFNITELKRIKLEDNKHYHELMLLGAASGASANAGSTTLTIIPE